MQKPPRAKMKPVEVVIYLFTLLGFLSLTLSIRQCSQLNPTTKCKKELTHSITEK